MYSQCVYIYVSYIDSVMGSIETVKTITLDGGSLGSRVDEERS